MKIFGFNEGDRSEYLAQYALSCIGHCIPVPRQADYFGVDLFLQIHEPSGRNLKSTGIGCAFQFKSNTEDINIDTEDQLMAIHGLAYPLFVGVISKTASRMDIYKTIYKSAIYWVSPFSKFTIRLDGSEYHENLSSGGGDEILGCGKPILSFGINELDHPEDGKKLRATLREVLTYWIKLDADALAWKANYLPMVPIMWEYETNKIPNSVPQLLTIIKKEHIRDMTTSLDNTLIAISSCCLGLVDGVNDLTEAVRQKLKTLGEKAGELGRSINPFDPSLPGEIDKLRNIYRHD